MDEPARYRYCPACGEEFRPDIAVCSDCGGALEDRYEGVTVVPEEAAEDSGAGVSEGLDLDPSSFRPLYAAGSSAEADVIAQRLARAGIAYSVTAQSAAHSFLLSVPEDALAAAKLHL